MVNITPCRTMVSDRFPVASFVVQVPPQRYFEVACATDPQLFLAEHSSRRTPRNFATSRAGGLLRAPAGQATYLVPPDQLCRFAGATRLYYALGSYGGARGEDPQFTIVPDRAESVPCIQIAPDFTGRALDRGRLGNRAPAEQRYGAVDTQALSWGGDHVARSEPAPARLGNAAAAPVPYDDGLDASLWKESPPAPGFLASKRAAPTADAESEGDGESYSAAARYAGDEPDGYEDARDFLRDRPVQARPAAASYGGAELDGYEDAPDIARRLGRPVQTARYGRPAAQARSWAAEDTSGAVTYDDGEQAPETSQHFADFSVDFTPQEELSEAQSSILQVGDVEDAIIPFDVGERLAIIHHVAAFESGAAGFWAINADTEFNNAKLKRFYQKRHVGLSWGFIQFAQAFGSLGKVLMACHDRDPAGFEATFGQNWRELLDTTTHRDELKRIEGVIPPGGTAAKVLWDKAWTDVFRAAGKLRPFQEAQRQVADQIYYEPYVELLRWLGFSSARSQAVFFDRSVHMGGGAAVKWILDVVGPVKGKKALKACLDYLGHADVLAFQNAFRDYLGDGFKHELVADGAWGPKTHAALVFALRDKAKTSGSPPPVAILDRDAMLQALVDEADRQNKAAPADDYTWSLIHRRLKSLIDDPALIQLPKVP